MHVFDVVWKAVDIIGFEGAILMGTFELLVLSIGMGIFHVFDEVFFPD